VAWRGQRRQDFYSQLRIVGDPHFRTVGGGPTDPAHEPFQPWPTNRQRKLWPSFKSGYLYSHRQPLGLHRARTTISSSSTTGAFAPDTTDTAYIHVYKVSSTRVTAQAG